MELPSGRTTVYGVVSTGSCVGVLPFLDPDTVVLVRQYRYVAGRHTWEMPTGGVAPGGPIEDAAQRELGEESGYRAGRSEPVCVYHTSKSVMDETAHGAGPAADSRSGWAATNSGRVSFSTL